MALREKSELTKIWMVDTIWGVPLSPHTSSKCYDVRHTSTKGANCGDTLALPLHEQ